MEIVRSRSWIGPITQQMYDLTLIRVWGAISFKIFFPYIKPIKLLQYTVKQPLISLRIKTDFPN